jgi:maleate isomerase
VPNHTSANHPEGKDTAGRRVRLGMLTPSSNTMLEPVTSRMLAGLPEVTAHFSRFRVTEISLDERASGQFDPAPMLAAADLLADARCDAICWNGTSAGWLGFERDRSLCSAIESRTGIRASSAVLSLAEIFSLAKVRRFGLVTPYTGDVQAAIVANFAREGYECVAERHGGIRVNFDFALMGSATVEAMIRDVALAAPEAIVVLCTNLDGASLADALEEELGVLLLDSIAVSLWGALRVAGIDPALVQEYGRLFREYR